MMEPVSRHATIQNTPMRTVSKNENGIAVAGPVVAMQAGPMQNASEDKLEQGIGVVRAAGDDSDTTQGIELAVANDGLLIEPGPVVPDELTLAKAAWGGERVAPMVNDSEQVDKDRHQLAPYGKRGNWLSTQWGGFTFWTVFTLLALMAACGMGEAASRMAKRIIPAGAVVPAVGGSSPKPPPSEVSQPREQAPSAEFVDGLPLTLPTRQEWTQAVARVAASEVKHAVELYAGIGVATRTLQHGLRQCKWSLAAWSDWDDVAARFNMHRHPGLPYCRDVKAAGDEGYSGIVTALRAEGKQATLVIGGPPCTPFSLAGRQLGGEDERSEHLLMMLQVAIELRAPYIVVENVAPLVELDNTHGMFSYMNYMYGGAGFRLGAKQVVRDSECGGRSVRKRCFLLYEHDAVRQWTRHVDRSVMTTGICPEPLRGLLDPAPRVNERLKFRNARVSWIPEHKLRWGDGRFPVKLGRMAWGYGESIQPGVCVRIKGDPCGIRRWYVLTEGFSKLSFMVHDDIRSANRRRWVTPNMLVSSKVTGTPMIYDVEADVFSVDAPANSMTAFYEPPRGSCQVIWDDRLQVLRRLSVDELARIQSVDPDILTDLRHLAASEREVVSRLGQLHCQTVSAAHVLSGGQLGV